ncbi:hypothetical protein LOK49_LG03G00570 [Camellia lanceoleosa]|uniref:Uncharacterized protein n=1 Tax=Camellia lanceoleosa TaxID=1840588 RepID=A0ACC0IAB0_9ERIC|nr:hypothetical protein LOK49_LG03G00570 [Camellia lanceoleosa]
MITFFATSLCIFLLFALLRFLHKVWWTPIRIQNFMASQGIKGPSYRFIHGSTKQISNMLEESESKPMEDISHHLFPRLLPHVYAWTQLYGKTYLNWHGPRAQLVVAEPSLVKEILNNKDGAYPKTKIDDYLKKLLGDGIVICEGEKWLKLRKIANHAFHGESLKEMVPEMVKSVQTMLERWRQHEGKEIEVYEEFRMLTSEIISRTAFGSSYLEGKNIFDMLMKLGVIVSRNELKISFPAIGKFVKSRDEIDSDKIEQEIRDSIIAMVKKRENKVITGETDSYGSDFLGSLLKVNHDANENNRISIDNIVDECKTFYIAGQETTNSSLAWSVLLLAIHTDWQDKARKEVLDLFGNQNPNLEGIARLKTVSMILNETMRLYTPVIHVIRKVEREVKLGKLNLPSNIDVTVPILALHHDPEIWGQDVHLFKPERFEEGVAKATKNIASFIPFSFGPRMCVGLNFANAESKIALSMILQRYKFTLSPTYVHWPIQMLTLRPQHGIQVIFHQL